MVYAEAVHEALRYGWIDGQVKRLDDDYYIQRFTPRRARSRWSKINCAKAEALIASGAMQPAGLAEVERAKADGRWDAAYDAPSTATVPDDLRAALDRDRAASEFFETLDSNNRYAILHRLQEAKKPETRARRIEKFVAMLEPRRDDSPTAPRGAVAAHLHLGAALVHRAPAPRAVARAVEEQPAALAAALDARQPVGERRRSTAATATGHSGSGRAPTPTCRGRRARGVPSVTASACAASSAPSGARAAARSPVATAAKTAWIAARSASARVEVAAAPRRRAARRRGAPT